MISKWVIIIFLAFTVCESKSHQGFRNSSIANNNVNSNEVVNPEIINNWSISNAEYISCSHGKRCKGLRNLKDHQSSCRVIKSMRDNIVDNLENDYNELNHNSNSDINVDNNMLDDTIN